MLEDGSRTIVSGGLKAGWSTDMDAAVFADILHEKEFTRFQILITYMTKILKFILMLDQLKI